MVKFLKINKEKLIGQEIMRCKKKLWTYSSVCHHSRFRRGGTIIRGYWVNLVRENQWFSLPGQQLDGI